MRGKVVVEFIAAAAFLVLSVTNILTKSWMMLGFTLGGFVTNTIFAWVALKTNNTKVCTYPSIITCALIFAVFVILGGNEGFASLWIALLPIFSMAIMDLAGGFFVSVALQIYLCIVLWTPVKDVLLYAYTEQFCIRFPIFFLVSFVLGLVTTISLQKGQYDAKRHLIELEKVTEIANKLAKMDSLTGLANRRCAYEVFDKEYADPAVPHCIIMGDIDAFKGINDTYGHDFGDEVIVTIARYLESLPESYLKSRWGGEEFLIAANAPIDEAYRNIEELRVKISQHEFHYNGQILHTTITFGIAEFHRLEELNGAINLADSRLYLGKNTSRNCTVKD